jgi:hypothetical protein
MVSVLAWVQDGGEGLQGGLGDFAVHGGLPVGFVPEDLQVEGGGHRLKATKIPRPSAAEE